MKNPEQLKNGNPGDFGIILGLDRCPEVKTLKRKLNELGLHNKSENYFKYMRDEYGLDHLASRDVEQADVERMVPNPHKKKGRAFIKDVFQQRADMIPNYNEGRLEICFHTMSTMRENKSLQELCDIVNKEFYTPEQS